jgi:hypothetical protein
VGVEQKKERDKELGSLRERKREKEGKEKKKNGVKQK